MHRKLSDILFLVLVLIILLIPLAKINLLPDQSSQIENRMLANRPPFRQGLTAFMRGVDNYIDDRIGFREEMMRLYNKWNYSVLDGNHGSVIEGSDGWLFFGNSLPDYTGVNIDREKTAKQVQILTAIDAWCKERDITFLFAVGPNKETIYDQYMPDYISRAPVSNMDVLMQALAQTDVKVYFPKDALIAHRDEQQLYFRQDTHWNSYGGRYLLEEMAQELGFAPYTGTFTETYASSGDLLTMLGTGANEYTSLFAEPEMRQGAYTEVIYGPHIQLQSPDTASFVCYRDSFTTAMVSYYSHYFHGPLYWHFGIDFDLLEQTRPEYLILSCVERNVDLAISDNAAILDRLTAKP